MNKLPNSNTRKRDMYQLLIKAFVAALIGFLAWNLDNMCCQSLRSARKTYGAPLDVFLQMHGWWHVFTAYGSHSLAMFLTVLRMELLGTHEYKLEYMPFGLVLLKFKKSKNM
ncbi:hypothetical protein BB559_006958 [Furculomyces boomerangus]|uniref:Alkaline ceramidase n=1 Tax=Furculomyces boomerangus TaxID=61424 RepID=A0A2T9XZP8_9FUNG|nr:hypothetical protein BB559_006958 [Furculomyces boomerangus]